MGDNMVDDRKEISIDSVLARDFAAFTDRQYGVHTMLEIASRFAAQELASLSKESTELWLKAAEKYNFSLDDGWYFHRLNNTIRKKEPE